MINERIELAVLKEILLDIRQENYNSQEAISMINEIWHEVLDCIERNE